MIKIAICDDDKNQLQIAEACLSKYSSTHPHLAIKATAFTSPMDLLSYIEVNDSFDIYLLDIFMPGYLGTDTARELRKLGEKGKIIFITSSRDHALEAFEVDASQYLVKPYQKTEFFKVLDKIFDMFNLERRHYVNFKTASGMIRLYIRNVVYTESGRKNYQIIHLLNKEKIEVRMTSTELFDLLSPASLFLRCGASININMKFVRQVTKEKILFDTGEQLSYPYRSYKKLKEEFLSLHLKSED